MKLKGAFILSILLISIGLGIAINIPLPQAQAQSQPWVYADRFTLDTSLDTTKWSILKGGSLSSYSYGFDQQNGIKFYVKPSSGQGVYGVVSVNSYPFTTRTAFNFQTSKWSGNYPYCAVYQISPQRVTNQDPANPDFIRAMITDGGWLLVQKRVNNGEPVQLWASTEGGYTWAEWSIVLEGSNKLDIYVNTGSGFSKVYSTTSLGLSFTSGYQYLFISQGTTTGYRVSFWYISITNKDPMVDSAISSGIAYLSRAYFEIPNTNYAVIKDCVSIPLAIYDYTSGKWVYAGQEATYNGVSIEIPCKQEIITLNENLQHIKFTFDIIHSNANWGQVQLVVKYQTAKKYGYTNEPSFRMHYWIQETYYSSPQGHRFDVYLGDTLVFSGNKAGSIYTTTKDYGLFSIRYTGRHATWMGARLFADLGYTTKATKLMNFITAMGMTQDFYDPLFEQSNSYSDNFLWQSSTFPDETLWNNYLKGKYYYPYKSRLVNYFAREQFYIPMVGQLADTSRWGDTPPHANAEYAMHLLNKYGSSKLSDAKSLIDNCGWNGFGVRRVYKLYGVPYQVTSYPGYQNGPFLGAVSKYYYMSGDNNYKNIANQVAEILLRMKWHLNGKIEGYVNLIDFPDNAGGFLSAYMPTNSLAFSSNQGGFFGTLSDLLVYTGVAGAPAETVGFNPVNTECTLCSVQGLIQYQRYCGGTPVLASSLSGGIAPNIGTWTLYTTGGGAEVQSTGYIHMTTRSAGTYAFLAHYFPSLPSQTTGIQCYVKGSELNKFAICILADGCYDPSCHYHRFATLEMASNGFKVTYTDWYNQLIVINSGITPQPDEWYLLVLRVANEYAQGYRIYANVFSDDGTTVWEWNNSPLADKWSYAGASNLRIGIAVWQDSGDGAYNTYDVAWITGNIPS